MKYVVEVSVTLLCSSCGGELSNVLTQSKVTGDPFNHDNPYERKDRRVLVSPCEKCFVYRGDLPTAEIPPVQSEEK